MTAKCRFCQTPLTKTFIDLGMFPLSNAYLKTEQLDEMEPFYPLNVFVCTNCFLVQLREYRSPDTIFSDYAYFSSMSDGWLRHAKNYVEKMTQRFGLTDKHQVIEVASNDGYLLQFFKQKEIPVLGIEPAANVAAHAEKKRIPTKVAFFGKKLATKLANENKQADLLLGNNVLAHVPDINDFVAGLKTALKPTGVITMEFPHLLKLMNLNQFDTIYHEHFSYLSFIVVEKIFKSHGLTLFDVEELPTHGGSLRIYARHDENGALKIEDAAKRLRDTEIRAGLDKIETYDGFKPKVLKVKMDLLAFLIKAKRENKRVVGYGAPAKGNTLLEYCGIKPDLLPYTVDRSPHKQGHFLPGTHIPIYAPDKIKNDKPDFVLILPWNIKDEVMEQMKFIRDHDGKFVTPIPELKIQ